MGYTLDTRHAPMTSDEPAVKETLYLGLHMPKSLQLALPPPTPRAWQYFSRRNTIAIAESCNSANATKPQPPATTNANAVPSMDPDIDNPAPPGAKTESPPETSNVLSVDPP